MGEARENHGLQGDATRDPSFGCPALWIDAAQRDHAIAEGFLTVDASTVIATHLNQLLGERPQVLLGPDEVRAIFDAVKVRAAGLVETIYPQPLSLGAVTRLFHALLEDGVSIAHPLPILSALSEAVLQTTEHDRLVDILRARLGAMIVARVCGPNDRLPVLTLDGSLEQMIVQGLQDPVTGQPVIEPDLARGIGERVAQIISDRGPTASPVALVVQPRAPGAFRAAADAGPDLSCHFDLRTAADAADRGHFRHRKRGAQARSRASPTVSAAPRGPCCMKHDQRRFAAARAYRDDTADRIRRFLPMVRRLAWHIHGSGAPAWNWKIWCRPGWSP
jgi:hypothetical protein